MKPLAWIDELNGLLAQFSDHGLDGVGYMNLDELWGVYRYLKRLKDR